MGIYPNVPEPERDHSVPHWCGWPIEQAVWLDTPCPSAADAPTRHCAIPHCTDARVWDVLCAEHVRQLDALRGPGSGSGLP